MGLNFKLTNSNLNLLCVQRPISVPKANRTSLTISWRVFDKEARLLCRWSFAVICAVKEKLFSSLCANLMHA